MTTPHGRHVQDMRRLISEVYGLKVSCDAFGGKVTQVAAKVPATVGTDQLTPGAAYDALVSARLLLSQATDLFAAAEETLRIVLTRIGTADE